MIRYSLTCANAHRFESWFASSAAYDSLRKGGHVTCAVCGDTEVSKALMAPSVSHARKAETETPSKPLSAAHSEAEAALKALKAKIEASSENVGLEFARQARAMHEGDLPHRAIYGETKPADAKALIEDGVPVAPLPFTPTRKVK